MTSSLSVLVDGEVFTNTHQWGIQRCTAEVLNRTEHRFDVLLGMKACAPIPRAWPQLHRREFGPPPQYNLPYRWLLRAKRRISRREWGRYSIFHAPYYGHSPHPGVPTVMVIHDMVCELLPDLFPGDAVVEGRRRAEAIRRATAFIAISESTREDFLKVYPERARDIQVVHHGADHMTGNCSPDEANPEYHALFVGDRKAYKNFHAVLDAMVCPDWDRGLPLRIVGPPFTPEEKAAITSRGLQDRIRHLGRLSDAELRDAYAASSVFLFPSLMEGFGFPLLEAQAAGAPVAASDTRVFNEIGGAAFERFDPRNPASIAAAVRRALLPGRSTELRRLGQENVRRFSWDRAAHMTSEVWKKYARPPG